MPGSNAYSRLRLSGHYREFWRLSRPRIFRTSRSDQRIFTRTLKRRKIRASLLRAKETEPGQTSPEAYGR